MAIPVLSFAPPPDAESIGPSHGAILLWFPVPGVVAARVTGFVTGSTAGAAYARIDAQPQTPYEGFLDLSEAAGFDWSARMCVFQWNVRHLAPQMNFHLLIVPRFAVTTRVLTHLLGSRVEFHLDRKTFGSAYTLAVKRKTRASKSPPPGDARPR